MIPRNKLLHVKIIIRTAGNISSIDALDLMKSSITMSIQEITARTVLPTHVVQMGRRGFLACVDQMDSATTPLLLSRLNIPAHRSKQGRQDTPVHQDQQGFQDVPVHRQGFQDVLIHRQGFQDVPIHRQGFQDLKDRLAAPVHRDPQGHPETPETQAQPDLRDPQDHRVQQDRKDLPVQMVSAS